jgi:hypothetical protein
LHITEIKPKIDNALIGTAGVHFIVSELSLRGLIALPTIRNTAGIDVVVASANGLYHANLQVKTSMNRVNFWPVGTGFKKLHGKNNFYVFLRYLRQESRFEVFLESADLVIERVRARTEYEKSHGLKDWAPCWFLSSDKENLERVKRQWQDFGIRYSFETE